MRHFAGEVEYLISGLIKDNGEVISGDLMNLISSTKSDFISQLVGQEALQTVVHPQEKTTIMQAHVASKPLRKPSVMRKGRAKLAMKFCAEDDDDNDKDHAASNVDARSEANRSAKGGAKLGPDGHIS